MVIIASDAKMRVWRAVAYWLDVENAPATIWFQGDEAKFFRDEAEQYADL